jgi:hypothetical protein
VILFGQLKTGLDDARISTLEASSVTSSGFNGHRVRIGTKVVIELGLYWTTTPPPFFTYSRRRELWIRRSSRAAYVRTPSRSTSYFNKVAGSDVGGSEETGFHA